MAAQMPPRRRGLYRFAPPAKSDLFVSLPPLPEGAPPEIGQRAGRLRGKQLGDGLRTAHCMAGPKLCAHGIPAHTHRAVMANIFWS